MLFVGLMWLFFWHISISYCIDDNSDSDTTNELTSESSTLSSNSMSMEILRIHVLLEFGNAVEVVWGEQAEDYNLNFTYGVHYGTNDQELVEPRFTTKNLSAIIKDLEFCTMYDFAVSVVDGEDNSINPNTVRTIVTDMDKLAPPQDLKVDFEPDEEPFLSIKWSASCATVADPVGYLVSAFEKPSSRYVIVTLPKSKRVEHIYHLKVNYGVKFDIKVSTNFPGSQTTETVSYKVPNFLQPYKVRITSNPDGAFMIYWREPYVPLFVGRYYYEVYIYTGNEISTNYERYYVTRPVLIFKGNESVYTFSVGLVSLDGNYRSLFTDPIAANLNGDTREINIDVD